LSAKQPTTILHWLPPAIYLFYCWNLRTINFQLVSIHNWPKNNRFCPEKFCLRIARWLSVLRLHTISIQYTLCFNKRRKLFSFCTLPRITQSFEYTSNNHCSRIYPALFVFFMSTTFGNKLFLSWFFLWNWIGVEILETFELILKILEL
jgi:hypothetical protein